LLKQLKLVLSIANEDAEAAPLTKVHKAHGSEHWHRWIERKPIQLMIFSLVVILIGGIIELIPTFLIQSNVPTIASVKPYTPLRTYKEEIFMFEKVVIPVTHK
jgi:cytochrome c oxidase cbb3-type subunit I/II